MAKKKIQRPKHLKRKQEEKNLLSDLVYYQQRGELATDQQREFALHTALGDSATWIAEPEFETVRFAPIDAGTAMVSGFTEVQVPHMQALAELPEEEREDKTFRLRMVAIEELLTPSIIKTSKAALGKFRKRMRKEKEFKQLAQAALIEDMLALGIEQKDLGPLLAFGIWQIALDLAFEDFLNLMGARQKLYESTKEQYGLVAAIELGYGEVSESDEWLAAVEETPALADFIYASGQREYLEALRYIALGAIDLNPFSAEEAGHMHKVIENVAEPFEEMPRLARALLNMIDSDMRRASFMQSVREQLDALNIEDPNLATHVDSLRAIAKVDPSDAETPLAQNDIAYIVTSRQLSNLVWEQRRAEAIAAQSEATDGEEES